MIDALIRWSLAHRPIVVALAAAFLVWGGWTASRIPLDVLPDLTAPTVTILTEAPGMDPLEIESLVTFPIESALNGAAGVRRVRSATAVGVAVVWVEFDWGQDIARARQTVTEKLTLVSGTLPPDVEPPFLAPVSSIMGEVLFVDLESDRHSPLELRTVAETIVRRRLLAVPGVSQVIATGGEQKQYEVVLDPARLAAHQVTLEEVETALTTANRNATAGFQVAEGQEYLVRGVGRLGDTDAIAAVAVKASDSAPVLIRDVGTVREGAAIKRGEGSHNARPAVIIGIQKQPAVNTLELTERIESTLDDIQRALPQGMQIHKDLFRQADFIEQSLHNLFTAFAEGAGLVIVVVMLFLMNVRAAAITLLALPLSLVAAVIAMDRFGLTLNSMSLGGLAIAIGELVDDAIIDVENVVRRLRENATRPEGERAAGPGSRLSRQHRDPALRGVRDGHRGAGVSPAVHPGQRRRPSAPPARVRVRRGAGRLARRRADGHAGAVLVAPAELAPDRVRERSRASRGRSRPGMNAGSATPSGTGARCWSPRRRCWLRPWSGSWPPVDRSFRSSTKGR